MKPAERHEFFRRLREINPHPKSDLRYASAFELLVAVILSAQATDKSVNIATEKLFAVANTPEAILALGEETLSDYVRTIGLFRTKAKNVIAMCRMLIDNHRSQVPDSRAALEALPGVGRKTANVVLNVAFGQPTMAVDTHIFRISNRMGLAPGKDVVAVEEKLMKVVPEEFMDHAHHWLILHGRYTCIARKPKCGACPVYDICGFKKRMDFVE
ncbi:MAG: endonuclease III [Usitatibacteraceae bacterium]